MEIHFLNVGEGDCSIIKHDSGRVSMIDICCGRSPDLSGVDESQEEISKSSCVRGNYNQACHPVNPIKWLSQLLSGRIFRFILTHPDMDHMDGIRTLFMSAYCPVNFWDTENDKTQDFKKGNGKYDEEDWKFYQSLRSGQVEDVKRLVLHAEQSGEFYNCDEGGGGVGDRISILSPTKRIENIVDETENYNDISYVLLFKTANGKRILFAGDSEKNAWDNITKKFGDELKDIDVLFAPHHGRKSGGNDDYLDILNPKITFLGNADSQHLDYSAWNNRNLLHFTNNQVGSVILNDQEDRVDVYCTNKKFTSDWYAENKIKQEPIAHPEYEAWLLWSV